VIEEHRVNNTGKISIKSYKWAIPKEARNITAYDNIGHITGIQLNEQINDDGKTKNVTMNLINNRFELSGGSSVGYKIEYYLPLNYYLNSTITKSILKINLNLLKAYCLIKNEVTMLYLYGSEKIYQSSILPEIVNFEGNSMVLIFSDQDNAYYTPKYLILEYKINGFQLTFRPIIISLILSIILSIYVNIKYKSKNKKDIETEFGEYIPINEIREYINLYDEINALKIELRTLEDNLNSGKIKKNQYIKERKTLETKLKSIQEEIKEFKKIILEAGGKISKIIQNIDLKETELESNRDALKLHEEKYRKKGITSKSAYLTLKEQMLNQIDKNQKDIDKYINELKSYLI